MKFIVVPLLAEYCLASWFGGRGTADADKVTLEHWIQMTEDRLRDIESKVIRSGHRMQLEKVIFPLKECAKYADDVEVVTTDAEVNEFDHRVKQILEIMIDGSSGLDEAVKRLRNAYPYEAGLCRILWYVHTLAAGKIRVLQKQYKDATVLRAFLTQLLNDVNEYLIDPTSTAYAPGTLLREWLGLAEACRVTTNRLGYLSRKLYPENTDGLTYYELWRPGGPRKIPKNQPKELTHSDAELIDSSIRLYIEHGVDQVRNTFSPTIIQRYSKALIGPRIKKLIGRYRKEVDAKLCRMAEIETQLVSIEKLRW